MYPLAEGKLFLTSLAKRKDLPFQKQEFADFIEGVITPPQKYLGTPPNTRGDLSPSGFSNISKTLNKFLFRHCDMLLFGVKKIIIH